LFVFTHASLQHTRPAEQPPSHAVLPLSVLPPSLFVASDDASVLPPSIVLTVPPHAATMHKPRRRMNLIDTA